MSANAIVIKTKNKTFRFDLTKNFSIWGGTPFGRFEALKKMNQLEKRKTKFEVSYE